MNRYRLLYLFVCCYASVQATADDQLYFTHGNELYGQGKYAQACEQYKKIEHKSFIVLYNIAVSYVRQENRPQAILYVKRAEKVATYGQLSQLYELYDSMYRQIDPDYVPSWYRLFVIFLKKCILSMSIFILQLLLLAGLIVGILCWYRRWYIRHIFTNVIVGIVYSVLIFMWYDKMHIMQQQVGIVVKNSIPVFAGPDDSFYKKSQLHAADKLIIMHHEKNYYQIRSRDMVGWVDQNDIELV